jgi:HEAT repeat protein
MTLQTWELLWSNAFDWRCHGLALDRRLCLQSQVITRRRGFVVMASIFVVLLATALFLYRPEPGLNGKTLTDWSQQYGSNRWSGRRELTREAQTAIRQIGPRAVPFLLDKMQARDTRFKKKMRETLPATWHANLGLKDTSSAIRRAGAHGLAALGTNAPPDVVPDLVEIATTHPEEDGRYIAVFALRNLGRVSEPAIPFLIGCLTNSTDIIREEAAVGLGVIGRQPEIVVAALMRYIESARTSPSSFEARGAISALRNFGTNARPATPLVRSFFQHEREDIRQAATNTLRVIEQGAF